MITDFPILSTQLTFKKHVYTHSDSVKTNANRKLLVTHVIQPEYKIKGSRFDYFKLPDSLNLDEDHVYQGYAITRANDIKKVYYLENNEQPISVKIGLIFGKEENKYLLILEMKKFTMKISVKVQSLKIGFFGLAAEL